ncbi:MAG TPA: rhodanese-like domain-containing protein [Thermoanaerobaculia bacterium]|nr:rhodanese-like domain-containing protein [Thermoanaerobaculia bacterium]
MEPKRITPEEARQLMDGTGRVTFIDSRNPEAWASSDEQLPGAIRVPLNHLETMLPQIPKDGTVVAYCT